MQALIGGSTQSADSDGVAPIHAILRGGDAVIVAGLNNKTLFKFVTQKEITEPSQLRKKKIGVANFGGSNEFAVVLALKEWNIPKGCRDPRRRRGKRSSPGSDGKERPWMRPFFLMTKRLRPRERGMRVLADIPNLVPNFPDKVITMRRSFIQKERDTAKRFLQAMSEAIYQVSISPEKGMSVLKKRLGVNRSESHRRKLQHLWPHLRVSSTRRTKRFRRCSGTNSATDR